MKRTASLVSVCVLTLALTTTLQGCSSNTPEAPLAPAHPPPDAPHQVTDLSQLAPGSPLAPFGRQEEAIAQKVTSDEQSSGSASGGEETMEMVRHVGTDRRPGEERLLNKKAAQFSWLSMRLMDQIYSEVQNLEEEDGISRLKVPTDLRWVIITGTLNRKGVLKELVIEQHSGTAAVDKMMVAACKKGLYIHNPPREAADPDGNYKVRVEERMENYASTDGEHWEFKTYLGLAIL